MNLLIDTRIRDWVLFPLLVSMLMVAVLRYYLTKYFSYSKKKEKPSRSAMKERMNKNVIALSEKLIAGNSLLPENSFKMRRSFLCKKGTGFIPKVAAAASSQNSNSPLPGGMPAMNPTAIIDMLKNNVVMLVSSMGMFGWVSYLFSGFILAKVPFPLTQKFKVMLQRGVEILGLDPQYVSSTSLYFLVLFGQSGLINLLLGSGEEDEDLAKMDDMQAMGAMNPAMQMGMMPGQGGPDPAKLLDNERENIELIRHKFIVGEYEDALIAKWNRSL
jgi:hypothetical protein